MKYLILLSIFFILSIVCSNAAETSLNEARDFFQKYVKLCHLYDKTVVNQYSDSAYIKRILVFPDKKNKEVILSASDYKKKLKFYAPLARLRGYKTNYYDLKYIPDGENVRIEGLRQVIYENYKTPISILVGKDKTGKILILEEILYTKAFKLFGF